MSMQEARALIDTDYPARLRPRLRRIIDRVEKDSPVIDGFLAQVVAVLTKTPGISGVLHSHKSRVKSPHSILEKVVSKIKSGVKVDHVNIYQNVTDLAGVRLLHLFPGDAEIIHRSLGETVDSHGWEYFEKPKAYSWDPESVAYFNRLGIEAFQKESYYTSVHYVLRPNKTQQIACEIQVRTLLEEVWGEIDHRVKYKIKSSANDKSAAQHLGILARLVSTGSRVCDLLHASIDSSGTR